MPFLMRTDAASLRALQLNEPYPAARQHDDAVEEAAPADRGGLDAEAAKRLHARLKLTFHRTLKR